MDRFHARVHHLKHHFKITTFTLLLVVATIYSLFVFFYVLNHVDSEAASSDTVATLTIKLNTEIAKVKQVAPTAKLSIPSKVKDIAKKRRDLLVKELKVNTKTFFTSLAANPVSQGYPRLYQLLQDSGYVEKPVALQGDLLITHVDFEGSSAVGYQFVSVSGTTKTYTDLHNTEELTSDITRNVIINATSIKGLTAFSPASVTSGPANGFTVQTAKAGVTSGNRKILVIMMNFTNNTTQPFTQAEVEAKTMGGVSGSLDHYINEVSYGKLTIGKANGSKVVGWYTIPSTSDGCWPNHHKWADQADAAARAAGTEPNQFDFVAYVMPAIPNCDPVDNISDVGKPRGFSMTGWNHLWMNGDNTIDIYAHEFGHNLGLNHAATLACGSKTIDTLTKCTSVEYGNRFDEMGGTQNVHYSAVDKAVMVDKTTKVGPHWIPQAAVQVLSATNGNQTIRLAPHVSAYVSTPQLLQVNSTSGRVYFVEYRRRTGYDTKLTPELTGVTATDPGVAFLYNYEVSISNFTRLLDMSPGDGKFSNSYFKDNVPFVEGLSPLKITQTSHDANGATFYVDFGTPPTPTLTPMPRATLTPVPQPTSTSPFQSVKVDFYNQQNQLLTINPPGNTPTATGVMGGACWLGSHTAGTATVEGREVGIHSILSYISDPVQGIDGACGFFFSPPSGYSVVGVTPVPAQGFVRTDNLKDVNYYNAIGSGFGWNPVKWTDSPRSLKVIIGTGAPIVQAPTAAVPTSVPGGRVTSTPVPLASCNSTCQSDANCGTGSGLSCYAGFCRKPACSSSTTCACQ